jgi:hypothetical protein
VGGCGRGAKLLKYSVTAVTQTVPITPMSAAMMAGSIDLLFVDIPFPISKIFFNSTACEKPTVLRKRYLEAYSSNADQTIIFAIWRSILPMG